MKIAISRVCIGFSVVGAISAAALVIALNQPVNTPISPKTPEAKAAPKTQEKSDNKDTTDPSSVTIATTPTSNTIGFAVSNKAKTETQPTKSPTTTSSSQSPAIEIKNEEQPVATVDTTTATEPNLDPDIDIDSSPDIDNDTDGDTGDDIDEGLTSWVPPSNTYSSGGRLNGAANTYPYRDKCPADNVKYSAYGGLVCQNTSYASWKAYEKWGITNTWGGNASNYVNARGYYVPSNGARTYVDRNPAPYTIAVQFGGAYGHVMWVESVNENDTVNVTEYNINWPSIGCSIGDFCSRQNVGTSNMWFVHFE